MIAEVIVDVLNKQVNRSFDYMIPSHLEGIIKVGYRVKVKFGNSLRVGFVINIKDTTEYSKSLKEIIEIIDVKRIINEEFIDLAKYIAENNFCYYATALQNMIPTALKIKYQKIARVINKNNLSNEAKQIFKRNEIILDNLSEENQRIVYNEVNKGNIILDTKFKKNRNDKDNIYIHLEDATIIPKSKQGRSLVEFLVEINEDIELNLLLNDSGYSKGVIDTLIKQGIISEYIKNNQNEKSEIIINNKIELNNEQRVVFNSLDFNKYEVNLLHGVTGSGKTEVYMQWIENVIKNGRSAIMLVPEISLTPQITSLFQTRFNNQIAILHSRLSISEKYDEWKKIIDGEVKIVVGARSAIFAPLDNIGIIIIDECHESSYIQQNNPKYNAIDLAKRRAKNYNCPVVLGSATPNVVDYYYATNGEYNLFELPHRANGRRLDDAIIVDLREELKNNNRSVFSYRLQDELKACISKHEQAILFLNRRGYSSFVMCRSCGEAIKCPHCDVSLTYHQHSNSLKCHYCGYQRGNVDVCPSCGSSKIRFVGTGTEKIFEETKKLLPDAKILRVDMDTTTKLEDYEDIYNQFKNHEADVLVGTQMITKGLDFEDVTLVGVLNADIALQYPTYDATMIAFNLIEQVAGRAGRSKKNGKVIIQTYNPEHYVIKAAAKHNYEEFYSKEINTRKIAGLPPFSELIEIMVQSADASLAHKEATHIANSLKQIATKSTILGPVEAVIFKRNDIYRFTIQILIAEDAIIDKIKYIYPLYQNNKKITLSITRM
ncbi:MAG: primosomal protein N' [Anaeroplasma sp.]